MTPEEKMPSEYDVGKTTDRSVHIGGGATNTVIHTGDNVTHIHQAPIPTLPKYCIDRDPHRKAIEKAIDKESAVIIPLQGRHQEGHKLLSQYAYVWAANKFQSSYLELDVDWPPKSDPSSQLERLLEELVKELTQKGIIHFHPGEETRLVEKLSQLDRELVVCHTIRFPRRVNASLFKTYLDTVWRPVLEKGRRPLLVFEFYFSRGHGFSGLFSFFTNRADKRSVRHMKTLLSRFSSAHKITVSNPPELKSLSLRELEHACTLIHKDTLDRAEQRAAQIYELTHGRYEPAVKQLMPKEGF